MRRSLLVLAGGVALAGVGVMLGAGGHGTAAEITGEPLSKAEPAPPPAPPPPPPPPPTLDLNKLALAGDHYEAPLSNGARATLTLDPTLQAAAEKLLADAKAPRAAIVAMTPDGKILALVGRRTEDPSGKGDGIFDVSLATDAWAPAASVFKLVTASALVQKGVDPDDKIPFHGGIRSVLASNLKDDKRDNNQGSLTFGVAHSNNAILGKLAYQHLQPTELLAQAKLLGIDKDLGFARAGALALPETHDLTFAQAAAGFTSKTATETPPDPASAAWGSQLSVVGGAMLAATFADGGEQPVPHVVGDDAAKTRVLDAEVAAKVARMMVATCEIGSASKSFGKRRTVRAAGKTGTLTQEQPFYMQYSWFVGFAPADHPEIVVAVVLGNPESWQMKGHEVGQKLIDRATTHEPDHGDTASARKNKRLQW